MVEFLAYVNGRPEGACCRDANGFAQSADSRSSRPVCNAAKGDLQGRCEDALAFRMP
ncbi:hypothetical protein [Limnobacter profundi]|uniref:hypothetical protein n=1 Tax=Limnobacter profundi TaxID=2732163 RepID=UPI0019808BDE|nr:hypothetical protein [Limnobacter sp. SAORIC-580]